MDAIYIVCDDAGKVLLVTRALQTASTALAIHGRVVALASMDDVAFADKCRANPVSLLVGNLDLGGLRSALALNERGEWHFVPNDTFILRAQHKGDDSVAMWTTDNEMTTTQRLDVNLAGDDLFDCIDNATSAVWGVTIGVHDPYAVLQATYRKIVAADALDAQALIAIDDALTGDHLRALASDPNLPIPARPASTGAIH